MQNPTEQAEASIPTASSVRAVPNLNPTVTVRRKVAKRSKRWYQPIAAALPLTMAAPLPTSLQAEAEAIPARKKRRLEEPLSTTTDETDKKSASPDISAGVPPPAAGNDATNTDLMTETQPNAGANEVATGRWTPEEDAMLTSAVAKINKKWRGKEHRTYWVAVAALVPGRNFIQCDRRWNRGLDPSIAPTAGRTSGKWTEDEDLKLKHSVQTHGGKNWAAIAALVPGRSQNQCSRRWHKALDITFERPTSRTGKWGEDEVIKLKKAIEIHGDKNWGTIAVLVPGRTKRQCLDRWHETLNPSIDLTAGRAGEWREYEDLQLKNSVQMHGDEDWVAVALLIPGRTKVQCRNRWNVVRANRRTDKSGEDEDSERKDAAQKHGGKSWDETTSPDVSGGLPPPAADHDSDDANADPKTDTQPNDGATRNARRRWTPEEDAKLTSAVAKTKKKWRGKEQITDWVAIAALVPDRTLLPCRNRWLDVLDPSIDSVNERTLGKWTEDEDLKLKHSVQTHGGKNWVAIAALVPGRSQKQCNQRWYKALDITFERPTRRTGKWGEVEDLKLKKAIEIHGDKNWGVIAVLVPGRSSCQCLDRWKNA
jgi:hypothetical protein